MQADRPASIKTLIVLHSKHCFAIQPRGQTRTRWVEGATETLSSHGLTLPTVHIKLTADPYETGDLGTNVWEVVDCMLSSYTTALAYNCTIKLVAGRRTGQGHELMTLHQSLQTWSNPSFVRSLVWFFPPQKTFGKVVSRFGKWVNMWNRSTMCKYIDHFTFVCRVVGRRGKNNGDYYPTRADSSAPLLSVCSSSVYL